MQSPLALVLDEDPTVRQRARDALSSAGIEAVAVATPHEAVELLRLHPLAVVVAVVSDPAARVHGAALETLCRLRSEDHATSGRRRIQGRSEASVQLRRRVQELAALPGPVLFAGEAGSGRRYSARCLHDLASGRDPFLVADPADRASFEAAVTHGRGALFVPSIENMAWAAQEALAASLAAKMTRPRVVASIGIEPTAAAEEGRLSPALLASFDGSIVRVPALRERRSDIGLLVQSFIEELRRLNGLPALTVAPEAMSALEAHAWPGNVGQLRNAVESAVILATDGTVRLNNIHELVAAPGVVNLGVRADRRFREAKRSVVEAFERSYLEDLMKRHGGNVTGAAETSGMLRSALQRLLRKHALHSADFRLRAPGPFVS
jgi:DNA-binding NtrC family response regulator